MWSFFNVNRSNKKIIKETQPMYKIMATSSWLNFATNCHYHLGISYFIVKQCKCFLDDIKKSSWKVVLRKEAQSRSDVEDQKKCVHYNNHGSRRTECS
jgi:hypothetical protein